MPRVGTEELGEDYRQSHDDRPDEHVAPRRCRSRREVVCGAEGHRPEPLVAKDEVLNLCEPCDLVLGNGDESELRLDVGDDDPPEPVCVRL